MIDSHCHLHDCPDPQATLERARRAGVSGLLVVGTHPESWQRQRSLEGVALAFGLHPWWVGPDWRSDLARLDLTGASAVGEIGLDRLKPHFELQLEAFQAQLELARDHQLPVALHVVKAHEAALPHLDRVRGVMHSYSGSREQLKAFLERGLYISFSPAVLRGGKKVEGAVKSVPLERLLVETDSPYQTAEPADLPRVVAEVARLRGQDPLQVAAATEENGRRLFGIF
ncbi:TatD family deoxyribonuclease [bacterium CPR1]|nr:TatD family deoxyribonuclease [bacterium CPR1]